MSDKQPVAGTDDQEIPVSEENNSAQDDLDTLLSQYDKETKPEPKGEQPDEVSALREQVSQMVYERDMSSVVKTVRGDLDAGDYDDDMVDEWINLQARKDARIRTAWVHRKADPASFNKVMQGLGKKFQSKFSGRPKAPGGDELESAVRNSTQTAPTKTSPDDFSRSLSKMSTSEFNKQWADWGVDG